MSVKKNLTVAGLVALMAVPTFITNKVGYVHTPDITAINAHASQYHKVTLPSSYYGTWHASNVRPQFRHSGEGSSPLTVHIGHNGDSWKGTGGSGDSYSVHTNDGNNYADWSNGLIGNVDANTFKMLPNGKLRYNIDVNSWDLSKVSPIPAHNHHRVSPTPTPGHHYSHHMKPASSSNGGDNSTDNNSNANDDNDNDTNPTNTSYDNGSTSNNSVNTPDPYSNNNPTNNKTSSSNNVQSDSQNDNSEKLPQAGEINHQASELATSIVLGATSVGLGAMSMRKHKKDKDVASATPIQTNSSSNNGNNKVNNIINTLNSNANKLSNLVHRMSNK